MGPAIIGVEVKELKTHSDERGFFREVIRSTDEMFPTGSFQQWSHSRMQKDVVKAWHYHHVQTDWWYLAVGVIRTVLIDYRPESPTYRAKMEFLMGDGPESRQICVRIPPGVLHGCRVLSDYAHLLYITSTIYSPNEEGRIPFDSKEVGYDWGSGALVVDNDRRLFEPTSTRVPLTV
jgi:dTDP-4-dehydrorhamnose 3,5-epimerase